MADISALMQLIQGAASNSAANQNEIQSQVITSANLGEQRVALNDAMGSKANDVTAQLLKGQFEAQQASHKIAEMVGGVPDSPTSLLPILAKSFRDNTLRTQELDSISFFDNPLAWLPNQIEADATEAAATSAFTSMQQINGMVSSGAAAQKAIEQTITKDSMASALEVQSLQSKLDSVKLRMENSDRFVQGIKALEAGDTRQIELAKAQIDVIHSEESLAMQREHLAKQRVIAAKDQEVRDAQLAHTRASTDALTLQNEDRLAAQQGAQQEIQMINLGLAKAGVNSTLTPDKAGLVQLQTEKQGAAGQRRVQSAMKIAAAALAHPEYSPPIYGSRPSEAMATAYNVGAVNPTSEKELEAIGFVSNTFKELNTASGTTPAVISKSDTPEEQAAKLDQYVLNKVAAMNENVETRGSIYIAPKLGVFKSIGSVAKTPFYQKVLAPQIATGNGDASISSILELGKAEMKAGTISPKELADGITSLYSNAIHYNNFNGNFVGRGLPQQSSYKAVVPNAHGVGVTYDLSKRQEVVKMLIAEEVKVALPTTFSQFIGAEKDGAKRVIKRVAGLFGEQ